MASGILARNGVAPESLALVGIHGGGDLLTRRFCQALAKQLGKDHLDLDTGLVDIGLYRDDYTRLTQMPEVRSTILNFDVEGRHLVLIDDVIFTGRTSRAALESIFSLGRPAHVHLAVLVDRGHREFPIQPDAVGISLGTERHQAVNVFLDPNPERDFATLEDHKYDLAL